MAKENPYLDVQRLTKSFGSLVLFEDISFSIAEGQKVGLIAKIYAAFRALWQGRLRFGRDYFSS